MRTAPLSHHNSLLLLPTQTGVCTGLAWTREGGELLFIECSGVCDGGSGALTLTGKLGEVMLVWILFCLQVRQ
jgi:ATP-dependent Lon protease